MRTAKQLRSFVIPCILVALLSMSFIFPRIACAANAEDETPQVKAAQSAASAITGKWRSSSTGWWYAYSDGTYAQGLTKIEGKNYFFNNSGWMKTGWQKISGAWHFFASSGAMKTGWVKNGGSWYYLASDGKMKTGWQTIDKTKYFLSPSGVMKTGWVKDGGAWYFLASSGAMKTGWVKNGGSWYYLASDGKMKTGWLTDGKKYYLNASGAMVTGWQKISNKWYCFDRSGTMQQNKWVGNYWLGSDGVMATNTWVDGEKYFVDDSGKWVKGAKKETALDREINAALAANPSTIKSNSKNLSESAQLTGTVSRKYCYAHSGIDDEGYVYYLRLPKKVVIKGTQYSDIDEQNIILPDSYSKYLNKVVTISAQYTIRPTASIKEASVSSAYTYGVKLIRVFE